MITGAAGGDLAGRYPDPVIRDNVIESIHLVDDSVGATEIQDDSIDSGEIIDNSIIAIDIGSGAVGSSEIAAAAVATSELTNDSVTMAKMVGGGITGAISLTVAAGACADGTIGANGAEPGDLVVFSRGANATIPSRLMVTAMRASAVGTVIVRACNHGTTTATVTNQPVHVRTFR